MIILMGTILFNISYFGEDYEVLKWCLTDEVEEDHIKIHGDRHNILLDGSEQLTHHVIAATKITL